MTTPFLAPGRTLRILGLIAAMASLSACSAVVARGEGPSGTDAPSAPSGVTLDLTSANAGSRLSIEPVPEAVAALKASGFEPVRPGKLTVAHLGAGTPPISLFASDDNQTIIGSDPDLASLLADGLGLEYAPENVSWADWPLGTESGKYDAAMINITVTEERKKLFDFATYRKDVLGFQVAADSEITEIAGPEDIAGLTVGVGSGTNQEQILLDWVDQQAQQGLEETQVVNFDDQAASDLALRSGRIDAHIGPNASAAYAAAVSGEVKVVGTLSGGYPDDADIAVTTAKGNGLIEPVLIVLDALIEGGEYAQVLGRWGQDAEAIDGSQINPPGLKG